MGRWDFSEAKETPEQMFQRSHEEYERTRPRTAQERLREVLPGLLQIVGSSLVPPARAGAPLALRLLQGPPGRMLAAEAGQRVGQVATGEPQSKLPWGAAQQGLGELLTAPLGFAARGQAVEREQAKAAFNKGMNELAQAGYKGETQRLRDEYAEQLRRSRADYAFGKQRTQQGYERAVAAQEQAHAGAAATHAEGAAGQFMNDWKQQTPALQSLPSTTKGMLDAVYGIGRELTSKEYDKSLKQVIANAQGKEVEVPRSVAEAFRLEVPTDPGLGSEVTPVLREALERRGMVLPATAGTVKVDAAKLAKNMTGQSSKNFEAYRDAADALDAAGIGDPAARAAYKAYSGFTRFIDENSVLKGERLNPAAALSGFTSLGKGGVEELRRRGLGDIFRGPMQAVRGAPTPPPEIPKPITPPYVRPPRPPMPDRPMAQPTVPPDIRTIKNPIAGHPIAASIGAEMVARAAGAGPEIQIPALLAGYGAASVMPKELVTRAPLSPRTAQMLRLTPGALGGLADILRRRMFMTPPRPEQPAAPPPGGQ